MRIPPTQRTVFVVMASFSYEGSNPVRGFATREEAQAFADTCTAFSAIVPKSPDLNESDAIWESYDAAYATWRVEHPAGEEYSADSFYVAELPFGSRG